MFSCNFEMSFPNVLLKDLWSSSPSWTLNYLLQIIQLETFFLVTTFELLWDREQSTKTEL